MQHRRAEVTEVICSTALPHDGAAPRYRVVDGVVVEGEVDGVVVEG